MSGQRITIDPVTRLEGHGRIEIALDDAGEVADCWFQVPELRGFEQLCVGRQAEDMPGITSRICGICPEAHHVASVKALDDLFGLQPSATARMLRELLYCAFFVTDHATHFFALGGPDLLVGPEAPAAERNLMGVVRKLGPQAGRRVIECRADNHHVIELLGGRGIHPAAGIPGGWSRALSEAERADIERVARRNVDFAQLCLQLFDELVLSDPQQRQAVLGDTYVHRTYYSGTVDEADRPNFYDGVIRVIDPEGDEVLRYHARDYAEHLAERTEPWTYVKIPYLRKIGWQGYVDGPQSGIYVSTPLSRLNVADGMATPLAQREFDRFYEIYGGGRRRGRRYAPVHHRLATHHARLIELLYASERMLELAADPAITGTDVRPTMTADACRGVGIGCVEAPRGTLIHHYEADARAVMRKVNLIVGTTNNHAAIAMSLRRAAERLIGAGRAVTDALLTQIEMAFRLYDPCLSCASHALPGQMPLRVAVRDARGRRVAELRRD